MKEANWNLLNRQALGAIRLTLSHNITLNILKEKTNVGMMNALHNMYEKPFVINGVYFMRHMFNLKMGEGVLAVEHTNEFNATVS